jgi:hypothetical protein
VIRTLQDLQLAFVPLGGGSSSIENQTSIGWAAAQGLHGRLGL